MKKIINTILFLIIFCTSLRASAYPVGVWENSDKNFNPALSYKYQNQKPQAIKKMTLQTLLPKDYPVLIFTTYQFLDNTTYTLLTKYVKNGGKLILITPVSQIDDANFIKLSRLVGVNIEKITVLSSKTDINWVEDTLENNSIKDGSRIAKTILNNKTTHLAVFGDIEKHESAISLGTNGVVINWCWGIDAEKKFNEKSMTLIINNLLKKSTVAQKNDNAKTNSYIDYDDDISKLKEQREFIAKNQDIILNYSQNVSEFQQNYELSKINELWALSYAKKGDANAYKKYYTLAKEKVLLSSQNVKDEVETRGIWFDRGTIVKIKSKGEMARYFANLKNSGINTVYFETVNAGYTIYPSKIGTQNPLTKGRDPLAWAIDEAHARKIKLHAWVWVFAVGNDRHNKLVGKSNYYIGPVLEKNQKWALLGESGNFRPKNQPEFWIDPSNKDGINYLLKIISEIAKNYNVDGIQLDYIRYPFQSADNLMGFNHNSMEMFTLNTGEKVFNNNYQTNVIWNKWKEANINHFVRKVNQSVKKINQNLKVSASVFSKSQDNRLTSIQQNYENWIAGNYIDFLTPMSYSSSIDGLNSNLTYLIPQSSSCLIYPGIALKHVDETGLLKQIYKIREKGFNGVSFFAVEQLDTDKQNFLKNTNLKQATIDPTYSELKVATCLLNDYKTTLQLMKSRQYDLTSAQRVEIDNLNAYANAVVIKLNNKQLASALTTIKELEKRNDKFFKNMYGYNPLRTQAITGYLKRAENLISIEAKK